MNQEEDLSSFSMLDLFRAEVENQVSILNEGLLAVEQNPRDSKVLESLMRAAHSVKGAARIVQIDPAVQVAHALEDCFVAAQKEKIVLGAKHMDVLLEGIDFLARTGRLKESELETWKTENQNVVQSLVRRLGALLQEKPEEVKKAETAPAEVTKTRDTDAKTVRIHADNLNRLLGLAAETSVAANILQTFVDTMRSLKNRQKEILNAVQLLQQSTEDEVSKVVANELMRKSEEIQQELGSLHGDLETYSRRAINITKRLYREVLDSRMRPFREGVEAFPRMVRDVSRQIGKKARLEITGKSTKVDRDVLEKIEAPLNHLVRNSLDHGIETPEERIAAGKPEDGRIHLEASHKGGMLHIQISDDGRGINYNRLREKLLNRKLVTQEMAEKLSQQELLEFLFLPGFSTADQVTELSGRGVGLDVVYNAVREIGGAVQIFSQTGDGLHVHLQLPLTLSLVRTLVTEIDGELFAFPLSKIDKSLLISSSDLKTKENKKYFLWNSQKVQLISAHQVLGFPEPVQKSEIPVILVSDATNRYGIAVDQFVMQKDLVVRPIDPRLGKVRDVHAASILENGLPVLILDVQDMVRTIDHLFTRTEKSRQKRILVVEDSLTVREMERKLLESRGFDVDVAVDGIDGWNAARSGTYHLIITDFDMPRWNGVQLIQRIRQDSRLSLTPVIMMSYKEREDDRKAGLNAGADRYIPKSSFQDDTFLRTVIDLIGEA
jgi:two-component system sensor histidine kinase and response regulator WspE